MRCFLSFAAICFAMPFVSAQSTEDPGWVRIPLDARFRSEGVAAADLNRDGAVDVVAGDVWYQAPSVDSGDYFDPEKWTVHEIREPGEFVAGKGYSNSFVNVTSDIDRDGWPDVVIIGFPGDPFHWYRNPGTSDDGWIEHEIWTSACNESPEFEDLDGDGTPEFVLASQPEAQMGVVFLPGTPKAGGFRAISEPSQDPPDAKNRGLDNGTFRYSHGLGVADVNLDGRRDVVIRHGWWEAPEDSATADTWDFHPIRVQRESATESLPKAANIYARDFDGDGDADLILSSAHSYGVWWAEQTDGPLWRLHTIDDSYSQTHAMEEVDINGDGQLDYVTGKRFFAHNGNDPGGNDPVGMYWYELEAGSGASPKFRRHEIVAGRDTGVGTQFTIQDMNGDGRPDIVLSNKKGVNVLVQKR